MFYAPWTRYYISDILFDMTPKVKLSQLVVDWLLMRKFPVNVYESANSQIWWVDLNMKGNYTAIGGIVDEANPPYFIALSVKRRPLEYYNPADPEFFDKIEECIEYAISVAGGADGAK